MKSDESKKINLVLRAQKTFFPTFQREIKELNKKITELQQKLDMMFIIFSSITQYFQENKDTFHDILTSFKEQAEQKVKEKKSE